MTARSGRSTIERGRKVVCMNKHTLERMIMLAATFIILFGLFQLGPGLTGFVTQTFTYEDNIDLVVTTSTSYSWTPEEEGVLTHLDITGSVLNNGTAKVYLVHEGTKYVVYDSTTVEEPLQKESGQGITSITGLVVRGFGENQSNVTEDPVQKIINETRTTQEINETKEENNTLEDNESITQENNETSNESIIIEPITLINDSISNKIPIEIPSLNDTILNQTQHLKNITQENLLNETINVTEVQEVNKIITIDLVYGDDSRYDPNNDGVETLRGVVDILINRTSFNWEVDTSKLCTRWRVFSEDDTRITYFCNGNSDCCAFYDLLPTTSGWDAPYYSTINKNGETENNLLSAQVVYYDVNLSINNLSAEIIPSEWDYRTVKFSSGREALFKECVDTCVLPNLTGKEFTLLFELEGEAILEVDRIGYSIEKVINTPPFLFTNISNISLLSGTSTTLDLSYHFSDADGDELVFSYYGVELNITVEKNMATITAPSNYTGTRFLFFTANDSSSMAISNVFSIEVREAPLPEQLVEPVQVHAEFGKPVVWRKTVKNDGGNITLPSYTLNFTVSKIVNGQNIEVNKNKIKVKYQGEVKKLHEFLWIKDAQKTKKKFEKLGTEALQQRLLVLDILTGNASSLEETNDSLVVFVNDSAEFLEVEFLTSPPEVVEYQKSSRKKEIFISSPIHYINILASTSIPEARQELIKLYRTTNGTRELTTITNYTDTNKNGLIDRIHWVVPSLSNQTYEVIIEITTAAHLDENYTFIEDIFDKVITLDNNWSPPIYENEYVRVKFESPLSSSRDITIYVRNNQSLNTTVEVYHFNSSTKITEFPVITTEKYYKVFLTGMNGSHDTFDLKIVNDDPQTAFLEFDHIIDPAPSSGGIAIIKRVQSGSTIIGSGSSSTAVTIDAVNMTNSVLFHSSTISDANPRNFYVSAKFTASTTITFDRFSTTGDVDVVWYVAEFQQGVIVQNGTQQFTNQPNVTLNISIDPINTSSSFPLISQNQDGVTWGSDDPISLTIHQSAVIYKRAYHVLENVAWQVVQYNGAEVQNGSFNLTSPSTSQNISINEVDLSKSFVIASYIANGGLEADDSSFLVNFTNSTILHFERSTGGGIPVGIVWHVVEFTGDEIVQSGTTQFGSSDTEIDVTLSEVNVEKTVAFASTNMKAGMSSYTADDDTGPVWFLTNLSSSTNLRLRRAVSGSATAAVSWFVVEFANGTAPSITLNAPANASTITPSNHSNATLNFTVIDLDNDALDIYLWGANTTEQLEAGNNSLLAVYKGVSGTSGGYNVTYNWTAPVVTPDTARSGTDGPVLIMHFDNRSEYGETTEGLKNTTYDFSGEGNNGSFRGSVTINTSRYVLGGGSAHFYGGNTDDRILIPDSSNQFEFDSAPFSVALWAKTGGYDMDIIGKSDGTIGWAILVDNAQGAIIVNYNDAFLSAADTSLTDDVWHHVAVVFDTSASLVRYYFDGRTDGTVSFTPANLATGDPLEIGTVNAGGTRFNGTIDELAIWNRSLTASEIKDLARLKNGTWYWKVNATDSNGNTAQNKTFEFTVGVKITTMNITESLDPNPLAVSQTTSVSGHINLSTGVNVTRSPIEVYFEGAQMGLNNLTPVGNYKQVNFALNTTIPPVTSHVGEVIEPPLLTVTVVNWGTLTTCVISVALVE